MTMRKLSICILLGLCSCEAKPKTLKTIAAEIEHEYELLMPSLRAAIDSTLNNAREEAAKREKGVIIMVEIPPRLQPEPLEPSEDANIKYDISAECWKVQYKSSDIKIQRIISSDDIYTAEVTVISTVSTQKAGPMETFDKTAELIPLPKITPYGMTIQHRPEGLSPEVKRIIKTLETACFAAKAEMQTTRQKFAFIYSSQSMTWRCETIIQIEAAIKAVNKMVELPL